MAEVVYLVAVSRVYPWATELANTAVSGHAIQGLRVLGIGFRGLEVQGCSGLGFRVWGLMVERFRGLGFGFGALGV